MGFHRQTGRRRIAGIRGLMLSRRDKLLLAFCVLGILAAWLFYAASGPAHGQPAHGLELAAPEALVGSGTQPTSTGTSDPGGSSAGLVPAGDSTAPPAAPPPAAPEPAVKVPAASAPQRITYPAAGMDVLVHPLEPENGAAESRSIVPPETMDGYWLTPFGTPGAGSENTTYVIGHSWEGLDAPFNHLSSAAAPGDTLTVATGTGALSYVVDSVTTYTKSTLKDSPVWDAVPNRLVLISCYTEDPWGKNVVVVATPARGP
ncbi:class F sortase [Arthrobacter sp. AL12]|uniref:class F sortase n=1 Tax=Arthrobacter sp. AL12 TaxID=3042241 RepID=UPI00249CDB64|nr:class F sortase [Arthrobacter sp. AL12]MDI3211858.1 class F sortase [Arthrobacter sp. AL12]